MKVLSKTVVICALASLASGAGWAQSSSQLGGQEQQGSQQGGQSSLQGGQSSSSQQGGQSSSSQQSSSSSQGGASQIGMGTGQHLLMTSQLIGHAALSSEGRPLGRLVDVALSPKGGAFVLVETAQGQLMPVPWQAVSAVSPQGIMVKTSIREVQNAPMIPANQTAMLNQQQFIQKIYSHYKVQPSEGMGSSGQEQSGQGSSQQQEQPGSQGQQQGGQQGQQGQQQQSQPSEGGQK